MSKRKSDAIENRLRAIENKSDTPEPAPKVLDNPRIAKVSKPEQPCSFEEWQEIIAANFPDLMFSAEICLSVISQILITDITNPFGLVLVDVPSAGKTIALNFFAEIEPLTYATDQFTPASFVSNAASVSREKLAEIDLLPRVKNKTFIVRDLATLFSQRDDDLLKLLGILTRVLDGEGFNTESGVHGARHYTGEYLMMFLAATTPVPPRVWNMMGSLGARLFFLNLNSPDKSDDELADQLGSMTYKNKELVCREATNRLLHTLWHAHPDGVRWDYDNDDPQLKRIIVKCARLLARLRGTVNVYTERGDNNENLTHSTPNIEKPDRINQLLYNLCRGHAVACERNFMIKEDLQYAIQLATGSAPDTRTAIFRELISGSGELTTSEVEELLNCSKPTARKEMEKFRILKLCDQHKDDLDGWGNTEYSISLKADLEWFKSDECRELRGLKVEADKANLTLCGDKPSEIPLPIQQVFAGATVFDGPTPFDNQDS